ncbi:hypothetical protein EDD18DRAFT_1187901 [Armillaria luteobubalina]|uniref:Secreted protein n=1 Tax=Armillaria luteobubalina TaxID=153913 RepID=A0AA39PT03_9AGAR|nr:hypothetical protein EDD18DRAFT_1187901 [Armillaria luteobubalina]
MVLFHCLSVLLLLTCGLPREVGEWRDDSHPGTSSLAVFERTRRNHVQLQSEGCLFVYLSGSIARLAFRSAHCHAMLLSINGHNENVLYEWVQELAMDVLRPRMSFTISSVDIWGAIPPMSLSQACPDHYGNSQTDEYVGS